MPDLDFARSRASLDLRLRTDWLARSDRRGSRCGNSLGSLDLDFDRRRG